MTTQTTRGSRSSKAAPLLPTDGAVVCKWIEAVAIHTKGDYYGQPFKLTGEQRRFIWRAFERAPDGSRARRRIVYGRPKGYGKTELAGALTLVELASPIAPISPDIPVGAASFEQADLVFGAAKTMASEGRLRRFFDVFDTEILLKGKPGRAYRVAAAAGTNDGGGHTARMADEVHEWSGRKERVHLVLTNGLVKRHGVGYDFSTAGDDLETSLLGRLFTKGMQIQAGELRDDRFLFDWIGHPDAQCDLSTEEAVRAAIAIAYAGAGAHVDQEEILARFYEIPEYEFRRYYLNQFTATALRWLPTGAWQACRRFPVKQGPPPEKSKPVVLAFDGSYNRDSTALVGCCEGRDGKPYVFVVAVWERPSKREEWVVPREEVDAKVDWAMEHWRVRELACDPPGWHEEIEGWARTYGDSTVVKFETNKPKMIIPACSKFFSATVNGLLEHDGNDDLARHLRNAVTKEIKDGAYITKDGRDSPRKIDLAVAAVIAYDRWTGPDARPSVYEERGLLILGDDEDEDAAPIDDE